MAQTAHLTLAVIKQYLNKADKTCCDAYVLSPKLPIPLKMAENFSYFCLTYINLIHKHLRAQEPMALQVWVGKGFQGVL